MATTKTRAFKTWITELDSQATDYISEVVFEQLHDRGVNPTEISFRIEVIHFEEEEEVGEDFCQACEDGTCSELTPNEDSK